MLQSQEVAAASRGKRVLPPQNGPVGTYANDVLISWTYPDAGDVAAVSHPNVGHFALIVIPNFDQMVVPPCDKVHSFRRDIHAIDRAGQGTIQLSDS